MSDRAGHVIEIFPSGSMKNPKTVLWDPTLRENDNAELEIKTGETILVSRCGVVYVGGNVARPGAFPLCESNHTTLSEVIALAQGTKPNSYGATYAPAEKLRKRNAGGAKGQTRRRAAGTDGGHHHAAGRHSLYSAEHTQGSRKNCLDGRRRIRHAGVFLRSLEHFSTSLPQEEPRVVTCR